MKIHSETSLRNFAFWSGAKDTAELLKLEELDTIEAILEEVYPEGMDETEINDLFWFEPETICEWIGRDIYADEEQDEENED